MMNKEKNKRLNIRGRSNNQQMGQRTFPRKRRDRKVTSEARLIRGEREGRR